MKKPSIPELTEGLGISKSYASEILSGSRVPSRPLAIAIFRKTGWQHNRIVDLSAAQIEALEGIEPWRNQAA